MILKKKFYSQETKKVAKDLLGKYLVHKTAEGTTVGMIVETEAYLYDDPASHSYSGKSKRNAAMFDHPGKAYVYLIYGMYECFNIVTNKKDTGEAVLIRALEPVEGIELMKRRRGTKDLCSGPGKLAIAMGITRKNNGQDLRDNLFIEDRGDRVKIKASKRIGITKGVDKPYRYMVIDNKFVSKH